MKGVLWTFCCVLILPVLASAEEKATPLEVVQKVMAAEKFLAQEEPGKLQSFNDPDSKWSWGGTYIFVMDCSKISLAAHPLKPELIGRDLSTLQDVKGKFFMIDLCEASKGNGWVDYYWPKPGQDVASRKVSYVRQVPGSKYQVGAGLYEDLLEVVELVEFTSEYLSAQ